MAYRPIMNVTEIASTLVDRRTEQIDQVTLVYVTALEKSEISEKGDPR